MDLSSFITSLFTSFIVFVILMILFAWLSTKPGNAVIYYPNRILKGLDPLDGSKSKTRNPFAWIREAFSSSEQDVIALSGVDSAVYFVFLSTVFGILLLSGLFLVPIVIPLAITEKTPDVKDSIGKNAFDDLDKLSMAHIKENGKRLWACVLACYWVSLVSYVFLWKAYKHVSDLRAAALMSPEAKPEQFAVLVRDIPASSDGQSRKEQVDAYFKNIYPETFYKSLVVTENKEVNKIYEELEECKKKLRRAEIIYADSKKVNPEGVVQTHKTGFLGLVGKKVDSIKYYNEKIDELTPKLEAAQKSTVREKQQGAAVVFFTSRVTAAAAAQSAHARMIDTWTVTDAPEPRQILWTKLSKTYYEREIRQYVVYFIVFLTILFYMIPIGLISAFTTLPNLRKLLPFLKVILDQTTIRTVLGAYLPQLALIVFLALLPKFLLFLSKEEGLTSESHAERGASGKYFYFSVFNVFIGVTLGGTLFDSLKDIENHPNSIVDKLAQSLPGNATFFITFVALKFFVGYGLELSRIVPLIIFHLKRKYLCKTEEDLRDAWLPGDLGYATKIPNDLLVFTITLCYVVITPLIIPFGAIYFGLGWLVFRNQVLKVVVPKYESNGKMWPHIHLRIVASLLLFQVTMIGYFGVKKFIYTPVIIPLPILTFIFAFVCNKKFYRFFQSTALEVVARHELKDMPNMETVYKSFIPPSLNSEKGPDEHYDDSV
ncbi:putative calcium-dependent channel, 7TM region phosphate [Helianthus annuus]|uniref:Calcium-dependent channel, 7TM region phosphate n=1 Tax=Helianthus annuus TaxID=4232 RepID=A0A251S9S7_HELAN|nr:CSC1-like protein ERD4 [Helianthus annuus]KAF5764685.1 putative calcium-dependent channel, 7TM region phosphate [Helianthus annuus]KAJ0473207.1 putative calcium-dependent channel, 7TM region phosphate [Helianthus annuus]KAJ0831418.1 putative calcium-dependent channel, 7TM region phosphate [Helianthus annuus]KAJ0844881.1 putative calcium-dependent channel, 7TM region phosphate [Helianthus annuus]